MIDQAALVQSTASEYEFTVNSFRSGTTNESRCDRLIEALVEQHEWTDRGARAIVSLANDYGAFVLRNALALAVALDKEDGDLGF